MDNNNKNYSNIKNNINNNYKYNNNNNMNDSNNSSNYNKRNVQVYKTEIKSKRNSNVKEPKIENLNINF